MSPSTKDEVKGNLDELKDEVPQAIGHTDPQHGEIARLAYQNWQQRGRPIGTPEEDWFRAEEEIKQHLDDAPGATGSHTEPL
jgi:hypothetical protein